MKDGNFTRWLLPGIVLLLASLACSLAAPTPAAWVLTPTARARAAAETILAGTRQAAEATLPVTVTPSVTAQPTVTPTLPPSQLTTAGPWLLYLAQQGDQLVARNADGSAPLHLEIPPLLDAQDIKNGQAPDAVHLAVRAARQPDYSDLALYLIELPSGRVRFLTPLFDSTLQQQVSGSTNLPVTAAVVMRPDSLSWSPDGRYLAFTAALDGPSSDLYLYDNRDGSIRHLTSGSNQAASPHWSPDGQWIITQELETGKDGTIRPTSVWAVKTLWSELRKLYTPPTDSLLEVFVGWHNPQTLLLYSTNLLGGFNLRQLDLEMLKETPVLDGSFTQAAFDPHSETFLLDVAESRQPPLLPGLYLLPFGSEPLAVEAGGWEWLAWDNRQQRFMAGSRQAAAVIDLPGTIQMIKNEDHCTFSYNAAWLACWSEDLNRSGLRLYTPAGTLLQRITEAPVAQIAWQPDASTLIYISQGQLFQAGFPNLAPHPLGESGASALTWLPAGKP
jgi:hypothetical protein